MNMAFEAVPLELKQYNQWILWRYGQRDDGKWTKIPLSPHTGKNAATDRPNDWSSFEHASGLLALHRKPQSVDGIGFVFGYESGVGGMDADHVFDAHGNVLIPNSVEIARRFGSYTELSPSRTGLHTLIRATLPSGRRFGNIELYGEGRYFTVTGESYGEPLPLADGQTLANELIADIDAKRLQAQPTKLDWTIEQKWSDQQLGTMAASAANGEKFLRLWNGDIHEYLGVDGRPDQSRADFALIDILAFYTDSATQVRDMFMSSALGQRDKARQRPEYVNAMIARSFDRKPALILPSVANLTVPEVQKVVDDVANDDIGEVLEDEDAEIKAFDPYVLPPGGGLLADIASYTYYQAPYPMKEAALATALALMAGICGRQYQFNGSGLNLYIMLLANTGTGKEAMSMAIGKLFDAVCEPRTPISQMPTTADAGMPSARSFRGAARLTGKGLMHDLGRSDTLSFVSVLTEFAYTLHQMKEGSRNIGQQDMRQTLLDLYMKSTAGNTFAGHTTADSKEKIKSIASPAFSLLAESTPEKLYSYLDDDMVTSGLLPRMIVIETNSMADVYNPQADTVVIPDYVRSSLTGLCARVLSFKQDHDLRTQVKLTEDGARQDEAFRAYCRAKLRAGSDATNELWNRAHLNARRVAGLAAIGQDMSTPTVNAALFDWAASIVHRQTLLLVGKFTRGETGIVGYTEADQMQILRKIVQQYKTQRLTKSLEKRFQFARNEGVISYSYMHIYASNYSAFRKDKREVAGALRNCIEIMKKSGELVPALLQGHGGEHYRIT